MIYVGAIPLFVPTLACIIMTGLQLQRKSLANVLSAIDSIAQFSCSYKRYRCFEIEPDRLSNEKKIPIIHISLEDYSLDTAKKRCGNKNNILNLLLVFLQKTGTKIFSDMVQRYGIQYKLQCKFIFSVSLKTCLKSIVTYRE